MSRIKHLEIRGIRSFDPNDSQTISFYTPLTIIVGKNGCGKTTLIECLKYATTGELPPNSKQGAFINDPKLSGSNKVKAQVRLTFYNIKGKRMQVVRGMELTQNKASKTQKTTLSTLMCIDDAKERSLTSTCSELDTEMPLHLGVSKAILENVIFCHQEESYWPLSEPAILKKKFDEIFAATRYTKALDNIKSLKKDKTGDLKVQENELLHLKNSFSKSSKVRDTKNQVHSLMIETELRIATLDGGEIEGLVDQMTGLMDQNQKYQKLMSDQKSISLEKEILVKNLKDLEENLELYHESEEDLNNLLKDYRKSLQDQKNTQDKLESQRRDISQDLAMLESSLSTHCTLKGTYQAQVDAYQKQIADLRIIMKSLSEMHHFSVSDTNLDPFQYSIQVKEHLDMKLNELSTEIQTWKDNMKSSENELSDQFQSINSKLSSHLERKFMYETQVNSLKLKITGIMDELGQASLSKNDVENLQLELEKDEIDMEDLKSSFKVHELETKLRSLSADLQSKEFLLTEINEEISSLSKHADSRALLGIKIADRESKATAIESLKAQIDSTWKNSDGTKKLKLEPASIESEIRNQLREKENGLKEVRNLEKNNEREISALNSKIQMITKTIESKKTQINDRLIRIKNACGTDNYPEARENAEKEYDEAQESYSSISSAGKLYKNFISKFESSRCCPLCVRSYDNTQEEDRFMQRLVGILNKIPDAIQSNEEQLADSEKRRNNLRQLQSAWDDCERMSKIELPEFSSQLELLLDQRTKLSSTLEDLCAEIAALEAEVLALSDSLKKSQDLNKNMSEMEQLNSEIKSIERSLSISGSTKTMIQIQKEHEEAQAQCQSIRKEIDRVNRDIRQKNHDIQEKEFSIRDKRDKLRMLEQKWNERKRKTDAVDDLRQEVLKMGSEIQTQEELAAAVRPSLEEKEKQIAVFRQQMAAEESIKVNRLNDLQQSLNKISVLMSDIQSFIDADGSRRLENCVQEISNLGDEIKAAKLSLEEIASNIDRMSKQRSEIQVLQRTIDDNLKYRQMIREKDLLNSKLNALNLHIAEFDSESIEMQYTKLKQVHSKLVGERAGLVGELKQLQEQEKRIDMELATDYKDIETLYRKQLIMVKTERMAHEDLEKYGKALDAAIVKFHGLKLREINDIIKELWVKTYRGNDIETIEIRSDLENTRGNRSYNYRVYFTKLNRKVVMIKNHAELDMRGRCSAGQKVLASIIIRLALAETFCLNCGILALDEPTTNLDISNMESLAESLANIIDARKDQKNFQLIVITHDEKFMEMLGRSDHADYIWRVSKDEEGFSNLTRETIAHYI